jgi:hypothetical protein
MISLSQRIDSLIHLSEQLASADNPALEFAMRKAEADNPWFTQDYLRQAISSIRSAFLQHDILASFARRYYLSDPVHPQVVGLVTAGNIPMVGWHDLMCIYISGHIAQVKLSDKDTAMMSYMINTLYAYNVDIKSYIIISDRLQDYQAAIATGSNNTAVHFEYYFRHVPNIIRRNRNSIAFLTGNESPSDLHLLGQDIWTYYGLGCRNVSMLYVPQSFDIKPLFSIWQPYATLLEHSKYKNNHDYNVALYLLNKEHFLHNEFLILRPSAEIISRIGCLHVHHYQTEAEALAWLEQRRDKIQCIVSTTSLENWEIVLPGQTQCPSIDTYADGVDTMQFLLSL